MPETTTKQPRRGVTRRPKPAERGSAPSTITIRLDFGAHGALGPGKIRLLELVGELGSIAAAGKALGMSYRRAWLLIDNLNSVFREPLVMTQTGGARGGGAIVTQFGRRVIDGYRSIEHTAAVGAGQALAELTSLLAPVAPVSSQESAEPD